MKELETNIFDQERGWEDTHFRLLALWLSCLTPGLRPQYVEVDCRFLARA